MNKQRSLAGVLGDTEFLKFFLFDVLLATIMGFIAWRITNDSVSSFLISLVVACILLIAEMRFQLRLAKEDIATIVGFQREALEEHFLLNMIKRVTEGYSDILASGNAFFLDRAKELISDCAAHITKLQEGCMEIGPEDIYSFTMQRFREANHSVFATSFVKVADFWFRGVATEYLNENFKAVQRGVNIIRVFIVEDAADVTQQVIDLIRAQAQGGIDVKIAFTQHLTPDLLHDMGIFDGKYAEYLDLIPGSKEMRGARFYRNEAEVRRAIAIREHILQEAEGALEVLEKLEEQGSYAA